MSSRTSAPTPAPDGLARLRSFPRAPAPNDNPAAVKSNLPEADVVLNQNILAHHVAHHPGSAVFGNIQSGRLKLVELYVRDRHSGAAPPQDAAAAKSASLEGTTVCELTVEKDMLNVHGTFAGPCAVLMLDFATFSSLFALSTITGVDASGFSTSMNIVWHSIALPGTTLRFVSTSMSHKGRTMSARCEVYDKKKGTLIISATHLMSPVGGLPTGRGGRGSAGKDEGKGRAKL